ncbi:MAG TPA: N-acetylmuramic acid 6-phosphate etherase [Gemmatimonadales bacterium]|nr:N-acetylmuramic acid 6-phosphate etherase [Gemmatimonadales bacterium]
MDTYRPLRATERRHPASGDIDCLDVPELVDLFLSEDATVPGAVARARDEVIAAVALVEAAFRADGRLIYVGAGTSGRLGVLDASECPPTFGTDPAMVRGVIAGGRAALTDAVEGAEDRPEEGAAEMDTLEVAESDVVVGIAASGGTPFVVGALEAATRRGALAVLVTCADPPPGLAARCAVVIRLEVGPELVTGSTRLKAGTATKLVLNMLTTGAMIRLGKTYGNLMVDLQARNAKLHDRGERILMEVLRVDRAAARRAIDAADGSVRTAMAMQHLAVDRHEAEQRLAAADHRLRALLGPPPPVVRHD